MSNIAQLSDKFYEVIRQLEGLRLQAYKCPSGVWTIGYGHTANVVPGMTISTNTAENLLKEDCTWFMVDVLRVLPDVRGNELDALTLLAYNIGTSAFQKSTLVKVLQQDPKNYDEIAKQWRSWCYNNKVRSRGLALRREKELQMFLGVNYKPSKK